MAATKRRRFMVNIPPEVAPLVEARAKSMRRSMSNYLEWLVTKDLEGGGAMSVEEPAAPYGPNETAPRVVSPAHLRPHEKTVVAKKKVG